MYPVSPINLPCGALFFFDDHACQVRFNKKTQLHYWKLVAKIPKNIQLNEIDYDAFDYDNVPQIHDCKFCNGTTPLTNTTTTPLTNTKQVQEKFKFDDVPKPGPGRPKKEKRNSRSPTSYNIFVQNVLTHLKKKELNNNENMKRTADLWNIIQNIKKQLPLNEDIFNKIKQLYNQKFGEDLTQKVIDAIQASKIFEEI